MTKPPKLQPADAFPMLVRLGTEGKRAVYLRPHASEAAINRMQDTARRDLGEAIPDGYVALLRITNGVQINGVYFKEAENLVLENLDVPHAEIIVLGNEGIWAEYVFDTRDQRFHEISPGFPDEQLASFDTFEKMLLAVIRDQLAL